MTSTYHPYARSVTSKSMYAQGSLPPPVGPNRSLCHDIVVLKFSCVKIWDSANLDVLTTVALEDANDLACMTLQENHDLIAVGSQHWVTLIDRRSAIIINQIRS